MMTTIEHDALTEGYIGRMRALGVPPGLQAGIARYLVDRIRPGGFLCAVLANDLRDAIARADEDSREGLGALVTFLDAFAPVDAWGSPGALEAWLSAQSGDQWAVASMGLFLSSGTRGQGAERIARVWSAAPLEALRFPSEQAARAFITTEFRDTVLRNVTPQRLEA